MGFFGKFLVAIVAALCLASSSARTEENARRIRSLYSYVVPPSPEHHDFPIDDVHVADLKKPEETEPYAGGEVDANGEDSSTKSVETSDEMDQPPGEDDIGHQAVQPEPTQESRVEHTASSTSDPEDEQKVPEEETHGFIDPSTTLIPPATEELKNESQSVVDFPTTSTPSAKPTEETRVSNIICFVCSGPEDCANGGRAENCRTKKANGCATSYSPTASIAADEERHVVEKSCSEWAVGNHCEFDRDSGPERLQVCHCRGDKCNNARVPTITPPEPAIETYEAPQPTASGDGDQAPRDVGKRIQADWIDETDGADNRGVQAETGNPKQAGPSPYGPIQSCFVCRSPITCAVGGSRYTPCEGEESHTCVTVYADKAAYERVYRSMTFIPEKNNNKWNATVDNPPRRNIYKKQCSSEREIGCRPVTSYGVGTYACFCNSNNDCNNEVCALSRICDEKDSAVHAAPFTFITPLALLFPALLHRAYE